MSKKSTKKSSTKKSSSKKTTKSTSSKTSKVENEKTVKVEEISEDAKKVLDSLGVTRYCCRRMLLSHVEIADEILKFYEEKGRRKQIKQF